VCINTTINTTSLTFIRSEVSRISAKDVAQDSSGAKNVSAFIVEVAERLPKLMLPSISLLLVHLDGEVRLQLL
jgi:condensin complex subunit 1